MKKEILSKLWKAFKTAKDVSAENGLSEIRVPFRETDLIIEVLEEFEFALNELVNSRSTIPCRRMPNEFCEHCPYEKIGHPDKECWLHYLELKREMNFARND